MQTPFDTSGKNVTAVLGFAVGSLTNPFESTTVTVYAADAIEHFVAGSEIVAFKVPFYTLSFLLVAKPTSP